MVKKRPSLVLLLRAGPMICSATAVSLVFWSQLQNREHAYIWDLTRVLARALQTVSDEMSARILALERLAILVPPLFLSLILGLDIDGTRIPIGLLPAQVVSALENYRPVHK